MSGKLVLTSNGIQNILKSYNEKQAIAEYIWNGFDANADTIRIDFKSNELGLLENLEISDNGYGINFNSFSTTFNSFLKPVTLDQNIVSEQTSIIHGLMGVGRLTFFTFANSATWRTTYKSEKGYQYGSIDINSNGLNEYNHNFSAVPTKVGITGTVVSFMNLRIFAEDLERLIIPFLIKEFCWFIELKKNCAIVVNGKPLNFSSNVNNLEQFELVYERTGIVFKIKYVQWKETLHKEHRRYYFLAGSEEIHRGNNPVLDNNDDYSYSIYINSDFFRDVDFENLEYTGHAVYPEYIFLMKELTEYIKIKRKPILKEYANTLIDDYEHDGIFPNYKTEWESRFKKNELTEVIKALYKVEPKLFSSLNINQKRTFVRLLDLLLNSSEREHVFAILDEVVDLESDERRELASLFEFTRLSRVTNTIKLLQYRFEIYYKLKDLVFNADLRANEVNHLQKMIEDHYWIFGEQYHLLTAAEPKFEEALRRYIYLLTEKDEVRNIEHPHRLKEMDIFACRQNILVDRIENIVVELKHPSISLGMNQYQQVYNYLELIVKQPEFNAPNMFWEFYLIGNKFDTSNFIKNQIITNKSNGLQSLVLILDDGRIKFFVKTWSEVFAEFEMKHKHLDAQLKLEREKLFNHHETADSTVDSSLKKNAVP